MSTTCMFRRRSSGRSSMSITQPYSTKKQTSQLGSRGLNWDFFDSLKHEGTSHFMTYVSSQNGLEAG